MGRRTIVKKHKPNSYSMQSHKSPAIKIYYNNKNIWKFNLRKMLCTPLIRTHWQCESGSISSEEEEEKNPLESNECWHCVVVLWCIAKHSIPMLRFFFARSITRFIFLLQCDWLHIDWIRIVVTLCKVNNQLCCGRLFSSLFSLSIPIGFLSIVCIAEYLIHRTNLMGKTKVCASTKQATKKITIRNKISSKFIVTLPLNRCC